MSKQLPDKLVEFIYAINEHGQVDKNSITVNDSDPKAIVYEFVIWVNESANSMIGLRYRVWNQTRESLPADWMGWWWDQISVTGRRMRQ